MMSWDESGFLSHGPGVIEWGQVEQAILRVDRPG